MIVLQIQINECNPPKAGFKRTFPLVSFVTSDLRKRPYIHGHILPLFKCCLSLSFIKCCNVMCHLLLRLKSSFRSTLSWVKALICGTTASQWLMKSKWLCPWGDSFINNHSGASCEGWGARVVGQWTKGKVRTEWTREGREETRAHPSHVRCNIPTACLCITLLN